MLIDKDLLDFVISQFDKMGMGIGKIKIRNVNDRSVRLSFQSTGLGLLEKLENTERAFVMHLFRQNLLGNDLQTFELRYDKECRLEHTIFTVDGKETYLLEISY